MTKFDPPWRLDPLKNIVNVGWVTNFFPVSAGFQEAVALSQNVHVTVNNGIGVILDGINPVAAETFDFGNRNASSVLFLGGGEGPPGPGNSTVYNASGSANFNLAKFDDPLVIVLTATGLLRGIEFINLIINNRGIVAFGLPNKTNSITATITAFKDGHSTMTVTRTG